MHRLYGAETGPGDRRDDGEGGGHGYVARGMQGVGEERAPTLASEQLAAAYDARGNGDGKVACTLTGDHQSRVTDYTAIVMRQHNFGEYREGVGTLTAHEGTRHASETLVVGRQVRRLTPLECERIQGYPDGWTDIGPWTEAGLYHTRSEERGVNVSYKGNERKESYLPLDSDEIKKYYKIFIQVGLTGNENGQEKDYMSLDLVAEIAALDDIIEFEVLSHGAM